MVADGFASPLFAEALIRNRGAIIDLGQTAPQWTLAERWDPGQHQHLYRWDPWVRSYLVTQELVQRLRFSVRAGSAKAARSLAVTMEFLLPGTKGKWIDACTITRPPQAVFAGQLARVLQWAELREERTAEILAQIENQNCFWGSVLPIHTDRMRHTRELLEAAVQFAIHAEMRFKHELACWRPFDYSAQVQPMITTPGHGSLPSGHATQSYVIYEVLKALLNTMAGDAARQSLNRQFGRIAARVATNRVIAGVHFPVDSVAGRLLGSVLGELFCYLAGGRADDKVPDFHVGAFHGPRFPPDGEFDPHEQHLDGGPDFYTFTKKAHRLPKANTVLKTLWARASEECQLLEAPFDPVRSR